MFYKKHRYYILAKKRKEENKIKRQKHKQIKKQES